MIDEQIRREWGCPDLGVRVSGLPVPGSKEKFDFCPRSYLRTAAMGLVADHLIGGADHPDDVVSMRAMELEAGAISEEVLPPKVADLVRIRLNEVARRREYDDEERTRSRPR